VFLGYYDPYEEERLYREAQSGYEDDPTPYVDTSTSQVSNVEFVPIGGLRS